MIEITEAAQSHFRKLIEREGLPGLGVRLSARDPGTLCELIARNVAIKARVVAGDEREEAEEEQTWVLETAPVSGTAKVSLDLSSNSIKDITSIETDIAEIEVTENPRRRW